MHVILILINPCLRITTIKIKDFIYYVYISLQYFFSMHSILYSVYVMVKIETWTKLRKSHFVQAWTELSVGQIEYVLSTSLRIILWVTNNEYSIGFNDCINTVH